MRRIAFPARDGDALIAAVARRGRYDAVATFDLRLRRALQRIGVGSFW